MRFDQLEQFVALGQLKHFRQAAEKTMISTSALTRSIQTLEEEVGFALVTRSTRSVRLTNEGEIFLEYAKKTLDDLIDTKKRLYQSANGSDTEKLVIGYTNQASAIVPVSCGQFLAQYPHVKIEMQLQDQQELLKKLQLGEIDISVCSQAMHSIGTDIHLPDQLILFVGKNHPLATKQDISKLDFTDYPLYSCFSQSKQIQGMLNEAIDSFNKAASVKVGSIDQVMAGLCNSNHFAIASIEHASKVSQHPDLMLLKTNKGIAQEQLIVQTNHQNDDNAAVSHLLSLIEKTALSINS